MYDPSMPSNQRLSTDVDPSAPTPTEGENETLVLSDGRVLGFAEYGRASGTPLIFLHGYPSSRLEARGADRLARRHNIRLIAPERPGFGLSTFQPGRRILDYPADIQALTHHLNLSRFAILGGSGGGPYALVCAYLLPRDTISAVGVIVGAPPWESGTQDLLLSSRVINLWVTYWPWSLKIMTEGLMRMLRALGSMAPITRRIDKWLESLEQDGDEEIRPIEVRRKRLLQFAFESFAQGADGAVQEAQLLSGNWGFRFEDVEYNKIQFWHGSKDANAPIRMIRYMTERLPHAVLTEFEDENHFALANHLEEIMLKLVSEATRP